jgi:hypothetical protein
VEIDVAQLGATGQRGIWVVTSWRHPGPSFEQVTPPSEAEITQFMNDLLEARVAGQGAEDYVDLPSRDAHLLGGLPLLYATSTGAPYERFEFQPLGAPGWPLGDTAVNVQLFAEGGATVVEQSFMLNREGGRLGLDYYDDRDGATQTTENGRAVPIIYSFLEGAEVTAAAPWPWDENWGFSWGLLLNGSLEERIDIFGGDLLPVETGCEQGAAPADAAALARALQADPDLEVTAPEAASVAGMDALRMDVVLAPGASVCRTHGLPQVLTANDNDWQGLGLDRGSRMRLYLLDVPDGSSLRLLAIAIVAPEARFEHVLEAAAPILDTIEISGR